MFLLLAVPFLLGLGFAFGVFDDFLGLGQDPDEPENPETSDYNEIMGTSDSDALDGGRGADMIQALGGSDSLSGGRGGDLLIGGRGSDTLDGDRGDDILRGGAGADNLFGGLGADILRGGGGEDQLYGDGGDQLYGGEDADTFRLYQDLVEDPEADPVEVMDWTPGEDQLFLNLTLPAATEAWTSEDLVLDPWEDGEGTDVYFNDTLVAKVGGGALTPEDIDLTVETETWSFTQEVAPDEATEFRATLDYGRDLYDTSSIFNFDSAQHSLRIIAWDWEQVDDAGVSVVDWADGLGADVFLGDQMVFEVEGGLGLTPEDIGLVVTSSSDLVLTGSDVNDQITVEFGAALDVEAGDGDDILTGSTASDYILGDAGDDYIFGGGAPNAGVDRDFLVGGLGDDYIRGDNAYISGEDGADVLIGAGSEISGGAQNDTITGSDGATLTGGGGEDTFIVSRGSGVETYDPVTITDFNGNNDTLDVVLLGGEVLTVADDGADANILVDGDVVAIITGGAGLTTDDFNTILEPGFATVVATDEPEEFVARLSPDFSQVKLSIEGFDPAEDTLAVADFYFGSQGTDSNGDLNVVSVVDWNDGNGADVYWGDERVLEVEGGQGLTAADVRLAFNVGGSLVIDGSGLDDWINTAGADYIRMDGGAGDDMIFSDGTGIISGGTGDDVIGAAFGTLSGDAGDDRLQAYVHDEDPASGGAVTMTGGSGFDTFIVSRYSATQLFTVDITDFEGGVDELWVYVFGDEEVTVADWADGLGADVSVNGTVVAAVTGGAGLSLDDLVIRPYG